MRILRLFQITGLCLSLFAFMAIGHQYYSAMTAPTGNAARFVSSNGETVQRTHGAPSFIDSTKLFIAGLMGKEPEKTSNLAALHTRTRMSQMSYDERSMREMSFWMNFTSSLGFTGP